MGNFNDVFKFLCDEVYIVSGREFALIWNKSLKDEHSTVYESTVNRWKDNTLPHRFYLPRIVKVFGALSAERKTAGRSFAFGPKTRSRLIDLCTHGSHSPADIVKEWSKTKNDEDFLVGALEAAYVTQQTAREEAERPSDAPHRSRRKALIVSIALAAVTIVIVAGAFLFASMASSPVSGAPNKNEDDRLTSLESAVAHGDYAAARRLIVAGTPVNTPLFKNDDQRLNFLRCVCAGPVSPFPVSGRLEDDASDWGIYWDDRYPSFAFTRTASPAGSAEADSETLCLSFLGGEPYSFAHFYLNLEPRKTAVRFHVALRLYLDRETSFNNETGPSLVQALEVSVSKYSGEKRYELAWQWENVGEQAPQWRFWDPARGWIAVARPQKLEPRTWHSLVFEGKVIGDAIRYDFLSFDGIMFSVNRTVGIAALAEPQDYLAVAVQLDGNSRASAYDVYVKDFTFLATD